MADSNGAATRPRVSRRRLLELTGSSAFLAGTAAGQTRRENGNGQQRSLGNSRFTEVGLEYRPVENEAITDLDLVFSDDFPEYFIDRDNRRMQLTPFIPDHVRERLRSGNMVARGLRYGAPPARVTAEGATRWLPHRIGRNMNPSQKLQTAEPVELPDVRVTPRGRHGVRVRVDDVEQTVSPGSEWSTELAAETISMDQATGEYREVPDRGGGTRQTRVYETNSVEVVPQLTVVNHGELEVVEPEGGEAR